MGLRYSKVKSVHLVELLIVKLCILFAYLSMVSAILVELTADVHTVLVKFVFLIIIVNGIMD